MHVAGVDYENTSEVFVFTEEVSITVSVLIYDDQITETTEHFYGHIHVQDTAVTTFIDVSNVTIIDDEGKQGFIRTEQCTVFTRLVLIVNGLLNRNLK